MIHRIYAYIATFAVIVLAILGIRQGGKQAGKQQAEAQYNEEQLQAIKEVQKRVHDAGDVNRDDVINSLRKGDF